MGTPIDQNQMVLYPEGAGINNTYSLVSGMAILPIAAMPPTDAEALAEWSPVVILQLHAPYRMRRIARGNAKQNTPPVMATPQSVGAFVFLGGSLTFQTAMNSSQYQSDWMVSSEYVYVENCVSRPQDGFILGSQPFQTLPISDAIVGYGGLVDPTAGAILQGGAAAQAGYSEGFYKIGDVGEIAADVLYANGTFYPGDLFNDDLDNGPI